MALYSKIPLPKSALQIQHENAILMTGSCFASEMGQYLSRYKFKMMENPFGILYSPLALETMFSYGWGDIEWVDQRASMHQGVWYSWDHHGSVSGLSKSSLQSKVYESIDRLNAFLKSCNRIVITLGTAWVYKHIELDSYVANCHKHPSSVFSKELLSVEQVTSSISNIIRNIQLNRPDTQIILTVSPVRHLKDGFIENQWSKSTLLLSVQQILKAFDPVHYFPAYEIIMDELRDYRFYASDLVHPNELAIQYIWDKFSTWCMPSATLELLLQMEEIIKAINHRPFHREAPAHQQFIQATLRQIEVLTARYPYLNFQEEIRVLSDQLIPNVN